MPKTGSSRDRSSREPASSLPLLPHRCALLPFTRIAGVVQPTHQRKAVDYAKLKLLNPKETREYLGDGNFAGVYEKPDAVMAELWAVAVEETRELIVGPW